MNIKITSWPPVAIETLKSLWASGHSAKVISETLEEQGHFYTRNAVIGKINRLRLEPPEIKRSLHGLRKSPMTRNPPSPRPARPSVKKRPSASTILSRRYKPEGPHIPFEVKSVIILTPDPAQEVTLLQSRPGQCKDVVRYIDNDKAKAVYCGMPAPLGLSKYGTLVSSSWCDYHKQKYLRGTK